MSNGLLENSVEGDLDTGLATWDVAASHDTDAASAPRFTVRPLGADEDAPWREGRESGLPRNLFLNEQLLHNLASARRESLARIVVFHGDRPVCGVAGTVDQRSNGPRFSRLSLWPANGYWLVDRAVRKSYRREAWRVEVLQALAADLEQRFATVEIDLCVGCDDVRAFQWRGWKCDTRFTYISRGRIGEMVGAMSPDIVRRAGRAVSDGDVFDAELAPHEFHTVWAATLLRQTGHVPLDVASFTAMIEPLTRSGLCRLVGVRDGAGILLAVNAILLDDANEPESAAYWLSGYDAVNRRAGDANQLCRIESLRTLPHSVTEFDWVGANTPTIARYKATAGGTLVPYFRLTYSRPDQPHYRHQLSGPQRMRQWLRRALRRG